MRYAALVYWMLLSLICKSTSSFISRSKGNSRAFLVTNSMSAKKESPSADRNKHPIWDVLQSKVLPRSREENPLHVIEIAAGSGVHTQFFASKLLESNTLFRWTPTDPDSTCLASIDAYIDDGENDALLAHVDKAVRLTLGAEGIMEESTKSSLQSCSVDLMIAINLVHISPWSATLGLMKTAGQLLKKGGKLYLYGPYRIDGACVESNLRFEEWLKSLDSSFGVRNLEDVVNAATAEKLEFVESMEMPANNLSVVFQKRNE